MKDGKSKYRISRIVLRTPYSVDGVTSSSFSEDDGFDIEAHHEGPEVTFSVGRSLDAKNVRTGDIHYWESSKSLAGSHD